MKQENDTPERIPGDPEGYDPVFDTPESYSCRNCALFAESGCTIPCAPCMARPEGRGIHYVKRRGEEKAGGVSKISEALRLADELVRRARRRFPKSPKHPDKFLLELTCAAVHEAGLELKGQSPAL